jgi:hypothetical protein
MSNSSASTTKCSKPKGAPCRIHNPVISSSQKVNEVKSKIDEILTPKKPQVDLDEIFIALSDASETQDIVGPASYLSWGEQNPVYFSEISESLDKLNEFAKTPGALPVLDTYREKAFIEFLDFNENLNTRTLSNEEKIARRRSKALTVSFYDRAIMVAEDTDNKKNEQRYEIMYDGTNMHEINIQASTLKEAHEVLDKMIKIDNSQYADNTYFYVSYTSPREEKSNVILKSDSEDANVAVVMDYAVGYGGHGYVTLPYFKVT